MSYSLNEYGLRQKDMDFMFDLFEKYTEIQQVILFGSRAKRTHELASDVDLAICGENVNLQILGKILYALENESPTFLEFDVVNFKQIKNQALIQEIEKWGQVIYDAKNKQISS